MEYVQVYQPDTCGCLVHQAGDQDAPDGQRVMRYVTHAEAVEIHVEHFLARPRSTRRRIWWFVQIPIWLRWRPALELFIRRLQPAPKLCPDHMALGYTSKMYDTVRELNLRKNIACTLAWRVANGVNDEDLQWVRLGSVKPILRRDRVTLKPYVTTEQEERMKSLSRVLPPDAVHWEIEQPQGVVRLKYLRDWFPQKMAGRIQATCNREFGRGRVIVT